LFGPQSATFANRLAKSPFRLDHLISATQLEQTLLSDPLASGTRSLLLVAAVIAALLGLLGVMIATNSLAAR